MILVDKKSDTLEQGINNMMAGAKEDYISMSTGYGKRELTGYSKEQVDNWDNKTKYAVFLYNFNVFLTMYHSCFLIPIIVLFF